MNKMFIKLLKIYKFILVYLGISILYASGKLKVFLQEFQKMDYVC